MDKGIRKTNRTWMQNNKNGLRCYASIIKRLDSRGKLKDDGKKTKFIKRINWCDHVKIPIRIEDPHS